MTALKKENKVLRHYIQGRKDFIKREVQMIPHTASGRHVDVFITVNGKMNRQRVCRSSIKTAPEGVRLH